MSVDHSAVEHKPFVESAEPMNRAERMKLLRKLIDELFEEGSQ